MNRQVVIYTSGFCGYCTRAKRLLDSKGVKYEEIRIDQHPDKRDEMLARSNGSRSVPRSLLTIITSAVVMIFMPWTARASWTPASVLPTPVSTAMHVVCPHCDGINRVPAERLAAGGKCGKCGKPLFTGLPLELSQSNFERHTSRSDVPVLVDFWAPWCGPCKMMAPVFAQAAQQLEPRMRLAKVNTELEQNLAAQFAIRSIPTLVIFRQGRELARMAGAMDLQNLLVWARQAL